jgi:PAS domain-containing protein
VGERGVRRNAAEHEQADRAMHDSQQRLQSIVDNAATVIAVKQLDRHYALVNRRFEEVFHIEREHRADRTTTCLRQSVRTLAAKRMSTSWRVKSSSGRRWSPSTTGCTRTSP